MFHGNGNGSQIASKIADNSEVTSVEKKKEIIIRGKSEKSRTCILLL